MLGQLCRKQVVPEIGLEVLDEIDYQRHTLQWDVYWGSPPRIDLRTLTRGACKDRLIGADSDGRVSNMTTICYIKHFIYWRDSMVHKEIEYVGEILADGPLSVPEELCHALELAPNVQLQVTIRLVQPDIEQSQAAWEVFRRLGQDCQARLFA